MDLDRNKVILDAFEKLDKLLGDYIPPQVTESMIAGHQAFLWDGRRKLLKPVKRPVNIDAGTLLGIEDQKTRVMDNTRSFIKGSKANNILLWGDRGTGKSSLIKSLLSAMKGSSLRMIQVLKHDILAISDIFEIAAGNPRFRFIIFIDDLSFEESQTDYKEMKTIMDGGLEDLPDNILFYATSNRMRLVPTRFSDNDSDDARPGDSAEEKISLADRFGIRLGFYHISQDTYLEIAGLYAKQYGVSKEFFNLHDAALRWSVEAGGRNGRIAEQFARSIAAMALK
jgi:predicted AAA+ superfamily ATPase